MGAFSFDIPFGFYPQKDNETPLGLDASVSRQVGFARHLLKTRRGSLRRFLSKIETHADEFAQAALSEVSDIVSQLRFDARKHGVNEDLVARAFALIREMGGRKLGMRHYRHQFVGAWAMMQGMVTEMDTGQGKTLCATLTAGTAALAGVPTHVITVNEYLARRDAQSMAPLYEALGLSVAVVLESMSEPDKQKAYAHDIVYCTNKQVAFDYLRDRIVMSRHDCVRNFQLEALHHQAPGIDKLMLRGLCFAIIDEADSVLIDEAVTPLVISATRESKEKRRIYERALSFAQALSPVTDFTLLAHEERAQLTLRGCQRLDDMGKAAGGLWTGPMPREELVTQALKVVHFLLRDKHYLVDEAQNKIQLIDEFTGRVMADRSWETGIQQMVEIKEGCALSDTRETLAKISYQRFFRRYVNIAGMTGTADEVKRELRAVYGLDVYRVQPAQRAVKVFLPTMFCPDEDEKWRHVAERVASVHAQGRPVLVGTKTVKASLHLSSLLTKAGLKHQLLNAQHHEDEADVVSRAGELACITVATNMAGRGTDIKLSDEVRQMGGLHVLATERHESRRIDRQLYGRCGRQGDPGTVELVVSMQDELIVRHASTLWRQAAAVAAWLGSGLGHAALERVFSDCQKLAERRQQAARHQVLMADEHHAKVLAFSGRME